jgi:hypothetical protein
VLAGTHQVECAPANGGAPDAGYFADPGCGAGGEDDDVTPAVEVVGRPVDERGGPPETGR